MIRADMMTKTKRASYKAAVDKAVERCLRSPRHNHRPFDCVVEELHGRGTHGTPPTEAQSKIIESAVHKSKVRVHHATRAVEPDRTSATELKMFIDNDYALHKQQGVLIQKNLATKKMRSLYKHDLAVKAFGYLVESGAKKYAKAFSVGTDWHTMFDVPTRKLVAEELASDFERDFEVGQYDELLPKKYQKELQKKHLVPPHRRAHASKKVSWKAPESLKIVWSPTNQAYFALWPGRGPIKDQQVLKTASAEDMHGWLRDTYGDAYGIAGRTLSRSHATIHHSITAKDIREFRGFLSNATDRQVQGIYEKESRAGRDEYAELAVAEAERRGIELDRHDHARKKSKTQLDREIARVVPAWRAGR